MNSSNPTEDQHFVPRFYLKNFASEDCYLEVLNIKERRLGKRRPYQGLGYAHYFYAVKTGVKDTISQHIEEYFKSIENFIAREMPRIISVILGNQHIKDDDRYILAVLMSMLWLRTPGMRNQLKQEENNIIKQVNKLYGSNNADRFKRSDNIVHLKFMVDTLGFGGPGFANMFCQMKWKVYVVHGNEVFITSDSPVVESWLPSKGHYGVPFIERDKYFALTPKIMLELTCPKGATKIKRKTLYEGEGDAVKFLNIILLSKAQEFAYSGSKPCLTQLLAGIENPGKIEREYIEKYEIPWKEYHMKTRR